MSENDRPQGVTTRFMKDLGQHDVGGLSAEIANAVRPELERLLTTARTDLVLVGAIASLWAATGGTNALSKGIHRAYGVEEQRPFVLRYAVTIGLTLLG